MLALRSQRWLLVATALFLPAFGCSKKAPQPEATAVVNAKPKIAVEEKQFNFGKVRQGESVEHVFELQNQGNADLVIDEARGSCGCLATVLSANRIPAGGRGQVKVTLSTAGRQGKLDKRIFVTSNDPVDRSLVLSMTGEVIAEISVTPLSIWLREVKKNEKATKEFTVTVNEPEKVKITSVTIDDKRFALKLKSGDAKSSAVYELSFKGSNKIDNIGSQVMINSEGSTNPSLRVPVRVEVVSDLRYPRIVQFFKRDGQFSPVNVAVSSRSNKVFAVKKAEDPNKLLNLEIVESKGPNALIRASLADQNASYQAARRYNFAVQTSDKDEPKVEIGYVIYEALPSAARPGMPRPPMTSPMRPPSGAMPPLPPSSPPAPPAAPPVTR